MSSSKPILVPVRRFPSQNQLSLVPASEAFLSTSKYFETFLSLPIVPFHIGQTNFFNMLKRREQIRELNHEIVSSKIHESILRLEEIIALCRWLCSNENIDKRLIKEILSELYYRETQQSSIIQLEKVEFYDDLHGWSLPFPPNVLPSMIASHLSRDDLEKRLSLSRIPRRMLLDFYLHTSQQSLFEDEPTSRILLNFISEHWTQFHDADTKKMKEVLSKLKCIPTTHGMKVPSDSYLRSPNLSPDLPIITLNLSERSVGDEQISIEYPVKVKVLKAIGCRTIHVPTSHNCFSERSTTESDKDHSLENFIKDLLQQRKHMSDTDLHALRSTPCLTGS